MARKFSFWNEELRVCRNKVNKLSKIYKSHIKNKSPEDLILVSGNNYRKERAAYKKLLLKTKRDAWERLCINYNEKFGFLFNLVFDKASSNHNISVNPNGDPNAQFKDKINSIMDHFFPGKTNEDQIIFNYTPDHSGALDILDLELFFSGASKRRKSPRD
ncbi:hypothetical protein HNY73_003403 [Argiope bruennichi]|uniref:Uncharacterized protein n=1 Tax=Argiope bruennichi TaxID=94029 RepID=A0A8T0FL11_ARGBR|nr:hypothetical protein HNY73_003403 [Argiope bruennichi]